jgi:hypothetical protein
MDGETRLKEWEPFCAWVGRRTCNGRKETAQASSICSREEAGEERTRRDGKRLLGEGVAAESRKTWSKAVMVSQ